MLELELNSRFRVFVHEKGENVAPVDQYVLRNWYAIYKKTRWPIEIPTRIPPSDYHVYHFPLAIHSNTVNESILTVTGKTLESAAHNLQIIEKNKPPRWET